MQYLIAGLVAAAKLFMEGNVNIQNLPEDYISKASQYQDNIPEEILDDVAIVAKGGLIRSWEKIYR